MKALTLNAKAAGISQERSSSAITRDSVHSQSSTKVSSAVNTIRSTVTFADEGEAEQMSTLDTSTTSAATEDMDTNQHMSNADATGQ